MTGSTFATGMIVLTAVLGLLSMIVLVLVAAERPYFKRAHPDRMQSTVRGGVHLGDPRSLGVSQDEPIRTAGQAGAEAQQPVGSTQGAAEGAESASEPSRPVGAGHPR